MRLGTELLEGDAGSGPTRERGHEAPLHRPPWRHAPNAGTLKSLAGKLAACLVVTLFVFSSGESWEAAAGPVHPIQFGMDARAVGPLMDAGLKPDYAMMWSGVWLERSGWSGFDRTLDRMRSAGVTPAIHFYYWGNDISRDCLEQGCPSPTHGSWKDQAGWQRLAEALAQHVNANMKGEPVIVILETEFNKDDAADYEPLDGYLAAKAEFFERAIPGVRVALGFGDWSREHWAVFDRAAAASDLVGIQALRASTRNSAESYRDVTNQLVASATTLTNQFGKDVLITDLGLSSHGGPEWLTEQRDALHGFMDRRDDLRAAGVVGVVYRGLYDASRANTRDWFGEGERHFGLAWTDNGTWKPAMEAWAEGVQAERALGEGLETAAAAPEPFEATEFPFFDPSRVPAS